MAKLNDGAIWYELWTKVDSCKNAVTFQDDGTPFKYESYFMAKMAHDAYDGKGHLLPEAEENLFIVWCRIERQEINDD